MHEYILFSDLFCWGLCPLFPRGKKGIELSRLAVFSLLLFFPHCPIGLEAVLHPLLGQIWIIGVHQLDLFYA